MNEWKCYVNVHRSVTEDDLGSGPAIDIEVSGQLAEKSKKAVCSMERTK